MVQNMPNSSFPVLFIASLAVGGTIGTLLQIDERVKKITERRGDGGKLGQGIVTGCLLFCVGTLSILGPVQSALYQDHTFLYQCNLGSGYGNGSGINLTVPEYGCQRYSCSAGKAEYTG